MKYINNKYKENMKEDVNKNVLFANKKNCEIKSICKTCLAKEPDVGVLSDRKNFENVYYLEKLQHNNRRVWKVPWFILIMCFLQISLFCIANNCVRKLLMFMPETINEYWRCVTYILLHSDVLHLTMNVCLQLFIAFCLESEQGHLKVACIYLIGGVAGSLATYYLQPQLSLMGASAGVYAMLMSHIPHLVKNFHNLPHRYLRISCVVILFVSDLCFTAFHVLTNLNTNPRICLEAHAAGAISGMLFGFLIYSATSAHSTKLRARRQGLRATWQV